MKISNWTGLGSLILGPVSGRVWKAIRASQLMIAAVDIEPSAGDLVLINHQDVAPWDIGATEIVRP